MIYFIREPAAGYVKIGVSRNPWGRLVELQTGHTAALMIEAVIPGERDDERALHRRFAAQRVRGEWFHWRGAVASYVATLESISSPVPSSERRRIPREITRALEGIGYSTAHASRLLNNITPWSLPLAIRIWQETGHRVGPITDATASELAVLVKFADPTADKPKSRRRAA